MAGLLGTKHIAGTANFQITHGNLEARAERRELTNRTKALLRDLTERLAMPIAQVRIRMARRTTDTAANLVQLRQAHVVRVLDDKRVRVRNINAGFNNCGADQNINLAVRHLVHNLCDLFLTHFAVNDADSRIRKPLLPHVRTSLDGLHAVVQEMCIRDRHEAYAELQKVTPRQGSVVDTPEGRGKVVSTQMLRGTCKVQLDDSPEHSLTEFQCTQCCMAVSYTHLDVYKRQR